MPPKPITLSTLLLLLPLSLAKCSKQSPSQSQSNPSCAPGGNFDLSPWSLQLPISSSGSSSASTISSTKLQGCSGFADPDYFYTDPSTSDIVMIAPGNPDITGCAHTSGSSHCRTEFREVDPDTGKGASWSPGAGTNKLSVTMTVDKADDGTHGTAIGQVFASDTAPLLEMYYSSAGEIVAGVKPNADEGQKITTVGNVSLGTEFSYVLEYSGDELSVTINGEKTKLSTYEWDSPECYFKAGNYNQGKSGGESQVRISGIKVEHS